ncbi:MAG: hypothetical protein ACJ72E_02365 [Marmoricola sp.]
MEAPRENAAQSDTPNRSGTTEPATDPDVITDPARDDEVGEDWTTEGGATPSGPATQTEEED